MNHRCEAEATKTQVSLADLTAFFGIGTVTQERLSAPCTCVRMTLFLWQLYLSYCIYPGTASNAAETSVSLAPPFVLSIALSDYGCLAASTADGRIFVGRKGVLGADGRRVKSPKAWKALQAEGSTGQSQNTIISVSNGPIVAVYVDHAMSTSAVAADANSSQFVRGLSSNKMLLAIITLTGNVKLLSIRSSASSSSNPFDILWQQTTTRITKSNGLCVSSPLGKDGLNIVAGGVSDGGHGVLEVFTIPVSAFPR